MVELGITLYVSSSGQGVGPESEEEANRGPLVARQDFLCNATIGDVQLLQDQALQEHDNQLDVRSLSHHGHTIHIVYT